MSSEAPRVLRTWGKRWDDCVAAFVEFQRGWGFPDNEDAFPPSTKLRPPEVGSWMKGGQRLGQVKVSDPVLFGEQFQVWWTSLQPAAESPDNWGSLQKAGRNGFLLFMFALLWWGEVLEALGEDTSISFKWTLAVIDVTRAL